MSDYQEPEREPESDETLVLDQGGGTTTQEVLPTLTPAPETPARPWSPAPWTTLVGLACVAVAILVFVLQVNDTSIDWATAGPVGAVLAGGVLVLLGLLGMRSRRQ